MGGGEILGGAMWVGNIGLGNEGGSKGYFGGMGNEGGIKGYYKGGGCNVGWEGTEIV